MVISRATSPPVVLNSSSLVQSGNSATATTGSLLQLTNTSTPNILTTSASSAQQQNGAQQQRSSSSLALTSSQQPASQKLQFSENFWGEKINGFDVLCQNLKHSLTSVKDLEIFLRESANCEDSYGKVLNKLVSQVNKFSPNGTFNPLWSPLKELNERYASTHVQLVHQLHELIKEIQRYNDELGKKIKKIRENEMQTQNVVQSFQEIQQTLNKTREQYHNLCNEFEKQKRQLDPQQLAQFQQLQQQQQVSTSNLLALQTSGYGGQQDLFTFTAPSQPGALNSNLSGSNIAAANVMTTGGAGAGGGQVAVGSTADRLSSLATSIAVSKVSQALKLEKKLKQVLDDYKTGVDRYNAIRVDYERKLGDSCNHLQYAEETHLKQMRAFVDSYAKLMLNTNTTKQHIFNEFHYKFMDQYTVDYLLQLFVDNKRTGTDRPEPAQCMIDQHQQQQQHLVVSSPAPTPTPFANYNNLINDNESYNLFVGANTQAPPPSYSQSQAAAAVAGDLLDGRGGDFSVKGVPGAVPSIGVSAGAGSRGTPVFFSSSNLDNSAMSPYPPAPPQTGGLGGTASPISHLVASQPPSLNATITSTSSATESVNSKRNDSKGLNIFNVDFLGRNRNKEKKAAKEKAAAAAAAAASSANHDGGKTSKLSVKGKKTPKQTTVSASALPAAASTANGQYESLNSSSNLGGHSMNSCNRDSSSINSEDSSDPQRAAAATAAAATAAPHHQLTTRDSAMSPTNMAPVAVAAPSGSVTARSISSHLSLDLLDQLKISGNHGGNHGGGGAASDIDSEGFSIRPDSSVDLRRRRNKLNGSARLKNKDNEDMNNFYGGSSSTDSDDSEDSEDSEEGENGGGPLKVMLKIKPKSEVPDDKLQQQNSAEVLREISKNLQLKPTLLLQGPGQQHLGAKNTTGKKRTYYYNYGTANPDQAVSGYSTSNLFSPSDLFGNTDTGGKSSSKEENNSNQMQRSVSVGSVVNTAANRNSALLFGDIDFGATPVGDTAAKVSTNLLDLDFLSPVTPVTAPVGVSTATPVTAAQAALPVSMSLSKINENTSLYNIDEDKEVESSFQYSNSNNTCLSLKRHSHNSPALPTSNSANSIVTASVNSFSANAAAAGAGSASQVNNNNSGRFTPACFPGRTTPDFRHTTSLFEQQGIRASIVSPLTVNGGGAGSGSEIIPIAVAFNETIHAYFKMGGDTTKFKVKCFGCMKISFPFAILKLLGLELPQLSFRLSNLQIANQDLKINNQLIQVKQPLSTNGSASSSSPADPLFFQFIAPNLVRELKEQHQQNKMAAFFNFELLKYEFRYTNTPLVLNAVWSHRQDENTCELQLDYIHTFRKPLSQVNFMIVMPMVPNACTTTPVQPGAAGQPVVTYKVALIQSEPKAFVQENDNRLQILWQMPNISANGRLVAKFQVTTLSRSSSSDISDVPVISSSCPLEHFYQPVYVKFHIDNDTLSQVKFDIMSPNYKLSFLKERIETGKYFCNYDQQAVQPATTPVQQPKSSSLDSPMTSGQPPPDDVAIPAPKSQPDTPDQPEQSAVPRKPFIPAGSINSHIGSSVDILLNC